MNQTWQRLLCPILLNLCACGGPPAPCDPSQAACVLQHDFGVTHVGSGQEISSLCVSWTLHNTTDLWVHQTSLDNDGAYHHSNWFFVPERVYNHPDGVFPCDAIHFDEVGAALTGGVLFAQSTQSRSEVQTFPRGAVVHVPGLSRIVGSVHLLNAAPQAIDTGLRLAISSVPPAQVQVKLTPFRLTYHDLQIPPHKRSTFTGTCDLKTAYEDLRHSPFRMTLYYALPHYHVLGDLFRLQTADQGVTPGTGGQVLFEIDKGIGDANGRAFDPPIDLSGTSGLTFTCGYNNQRAQAVGWGIGDQEMCEMLGFADSQVGFDATVDQGAVQMEDATTSVNSGPCGVTAFNFYTD